MNNLKGELINKNTPPSYQAGETGKKVRSSNLELYRIICMLMIVAHHYVVNSGLTWEGGPIISEPTSPNSIYLLLFGAWGKTGINCFVMITGYFMCTSNITLKKYLKLLLLVYFYKFAIFPFFLGMGYETITLSRVVELVTPFWKLSNNFTGCFLVFYLTIPFWNILIKNLTERQHLLLTLLLLTCYTLLGSIPSFTLTFNYISWFGIIFLIASYIRLYPHPLFQRKKMWGWLTVINILIAMVSMLKVQHFYVVDSNKLFSLSVAVCMFLWFNNLKVKNSKVINAIGASTFGVLWIHANSNAMRTWLWQDIVDSVGHYSLSLDYLVLYSICTVIIIFMTCSVIDYIRVVTFEKWFFKWYDNKLATKADSFISGLIKGKSVN